MFRSLYVPIPSLYFLPPTPQLFLFLFPGGDQTRLALLLISIIFNFVCRVLISGVPFKNSVMLMVFCHCFNSFIVVLIFSFFWSNCWTFSSSSKVVQICAVLSNSYVTSLSSLAISSIWNALAIIFSIRP
jgi:hypothetical protein